jgi:hypothetical protein
MLKVRYRQDRNVAGYEQTPMDEVSGLPLLIVPDERVLPILRKEVPNAGSDGHVLADENHAFHPAKFVDPPVRNARVQFVMRETHDEYHAAYGGPSLPATKPERIKTLVLCAAGYVPPRGLAFGADGGREVDLTVGQRERLRTSGEVRVASFSVVQKYLKDAMLAQPSDHILPATIDRFLMLDGLVPDEAKEQRYLAHLLLSLCIDRVEDPLERPYAFGRSYDLLRPGLPTRPGDFIHRTILFSGKHVRGIVKELTQKFVKYRDGPEALARLGGAALT